MSQSVRLRSFIFTKIKPATTTHNLRAYHHPTFKPPFQSIRMVTASSNNTKPALVRFYEHPNGGEDFRGRTLSSILNWRDDDLEYVHNFIQILFPLPEGSPINSQAPVIDRATFEAFHSRPELRARLRESFVRMLSFYGFALQETGGELKISPAANFRTAAKNWFQPYSHNHLRITRIIRSLRVLGLEREAEAFFLALRELSPAGDRKISTTSWRYWTRAAKRPLYLAPEDNEDDGHGADFLYEFEKSRQKRDGSADAETRSTHENRQSEIKAQKGVI